MAFERQRILRLAADAPLARHQLGVLAHRVAGTRLAIARQRRAKQHAHSHARERGQALPGAARAAGVKQDAAHFFIEADGRVGGRVNTTGNAALDLAQRDLVGHDDRRLQPRTAGLLQIEGRRFARQRGREHALAHQVEVA